MSSKKDSNKKFLIFIIILFLLLSISIYLFTSWDFKTEKNQDKSNEVYDNSNTNTKKDNIENTNENIVNENIAEEKEIIDSNKNETNKKTTKTKKLNVYPSASKAAIEYLDEEKEKTINKKTIETDPVNDEVKKDITEKKEIISNKYSIYSWNYISLLSYNIENTIKVLKDLEITNLYHSFDIDNLLTEKNRNIVSKMSKNNIKSYYLNGSPQLYNDPDTIIKRIDNLIDYNSKVSKNEKIVGIVLDIEPYTIYNISDDPASFFATFSSTINTIYQHANKNDIEVVITIPYWYDGYLEDDTYTDDEKVKIEQGLKKLFASSDRISVMNFNKSTMVEAISYELSLAKELGKEIESIGEFKKTSNGISENISLWVEENPFAYAKNIWQEIQTKYNYENTKFSYHDLETILELKGLYKQNTFTLVDENMNSINYIEIIIKFPDGSYHSFSSVNQPVFPNHGKYEIVIPGYEIIKSEKKDLGNNTEENILTLNKLDQYTLEIYPELYNGTSYNNINSGKIILIDETTGAEKVTEIKPQYYGALFGVYANTKYKVIVQDAQGNNYEFEYASAKNESGTTQVISDKDGYLIIPQGFHSGLYIVPSFYLK